MAKGAHVTPADERTEDLRLRIDAERQALGRSLDRLGGEVRERLDWRRLATRHRVKLLAAGGGLLLAAAWRWRQRRRPQERLLASLSRATDAVSRQASEGIELLRQRLADPPQRRSWMRHIVAPLAAAAIRSALAWREVSDPHAQAGAARPTPPAEPEPETAADWNQEEHAWNRERHSTT
jgi:hypothetical protein